MSPLQETLDEYLAMRRALGHKLCLAGRLLQQFVTFADLAGAAYVTTDLALAWVSQSGGAQLFPNGPVAWGLVRQLRTLLRCAQTRGLLCRRTTCFPHRYQRPTPYIYRDEQISRLLDAARHYSSATGLRPHTYATLFGLYAVTGMRCQEPLQLDRGDVDLVNGVLTIRGTKFGKSRYVPLHRLHAMRIEQLRNAPGSFVPQP